VRRTPLAIVADLRAGTASLSALVDGWAAILPRTSSIATADATVTGISRLLSELRTAMREGG
jgi:hypothetical protein